MRGHSVRWGILGTLLIALIAAGPGEATGPASSTTEVADAERFLDAGRLLLAEQAARNAVELEPESARAHDTLGRILVRRERAAEAESELSRAADLDPTLAGVQRELGRVRFELERYEPARAAFDRALEQDPDDAEVWLWAGLCELELGFPGRAIDAFERAARDPEYAAIADFNIGVAHDVLGNERKARRAFQRALSRKLPRAVADRATDRLDELPEETRPWSLIAVGGLVYESSVVRLELDQVDDDPDGSGQIELNATYETEVPGGFEVEVGYDFFQSLYFDATEFNFQSHGLRASTSRALGPVDAALGYVFNLSTLGGDRFLDYHEVRGSAGTSLTDWWYSSLTTAYRGKRFQDSVDHPRDANTASLGFLQLFPVGQWSRYVLFGLDLEDENTKGSEFEYHGLRTLLGLRLPFVVGERVIPVDLRYRYERRDYLNDNPQIGGPVDFEKRDDSINTVSARVVVPLMGPVSIQADYEYQAYDSNLESVDRNVHTVGVLFRARI